MELQIYYCNLETEKTWDYRYCSLPTESNKFFTKQQMSQETFLRRHSCSLVLLSDHLLQPTTKSSHFGLLLMGSLTVLRIKDFCLKIWGARDGTVVRALAPHQRGLGSNPGIDAIIMCIEFVVGSLLCSKRFFSR